jgi:hypothetical protein
MIMPLRLRFLHAPRWLRAGSRRDGPHMGHAMLLVLGVIAVSLCFGAVRVVDAAFSGALVQFHAARHVPIAALGEDEARASNAVGADIEADSAALQDCLLKDVLPSASTDAISL